MRAAGGLRGLDGDPQLTAHRRAAGESCTFPATTSEPKSAELFVLLQRPPLRVSCSSRRTGMKNSKFPLLPSHRRAPQLLPKGSETPRGASRSSGQRGATGATGGRARARCLVPPSSCGGCSPHFSLSSHFWDNRAARQVYHSG